jgi:hypothetical protein
VVARRKIGTLETFAAPTAGRRADGGVRPDGFVAARGRSSLAQREVRAAHPLLTSIAFASRHEMIDAGADIDPLV